MYHYKTGESNDPGMVYVVYDLGRRVSGRCPRTQVLPLQTNVLHYRWYPETLTFSSRVPLTNVSFTRNGSRRNSRSPLVTWNVWTRDSCTDAHRRETKRGVGNLNRTQEGKRKGKYPTVFLLCVNRNLSPTPHLTYTRFDPKVRMSVLASLRLVFMRDSSTFMYLTLF